MAKKTKTHFFFLRFYDQTPENITKCLEEIKTLYPNMLKWKNVGTPIKTMNVFVPVPAAEVRAFFATHDEVAQCHADDRMLAIYTKYASGDPKLIGGVYRRKPGDPAF